MERFLPVVQHFLTLQSPICRRILETEKGKGRYRKMIFSKAITGMYQKTFFGRVDADGLVKYFSFEDFPGLHRESYIFKNNHGQKLQGWFYSYENPHHDRVVIFEHGYGGGHTAYMTEIARLAAHGYLVFAYDKSGCMESEGEGHGFAQSIADLDACLHTLKADPSMDGVHFSVVGHSWGAYATMNIAALHPDITHLVAICGPLSVRKLIEQNFRGPLALFRKDIYALEQAANPRYAPLSAEESLLQTGAHTLLIYSEDDKTIDRRLHYDRLRDALIHRHNIRFLLVEGKNHNPNYTADAVRYLGEFSEALAEVRKQKKIEPQVRHAFVRKWDWQRMTAQDDAVWAEIFETLDK